MSTEPVLLDVDGHVATLTLNVPDKRNAMSAEMTDAFPETVRKLQGMDEVRAVVVTGAGSAFCAGGDLDFLHSGPPIVHELRERMTSFYPRFLTLLDLDVPVVAAINGPAIGAGLCLALMADMRVATLDAPLGMTFVRIGIHPGMQATALLSRAVTHTWAAELLYTGRIVNGEEAARIGLVNRAVPREELMDTAYAMARECAANGPLAVRYLKQGLRLAYRQAAQQASAWEGFAQPVTMATEDVREGLRAVKEKRKPEFKGR